MAVRVQFLQALIRAQTEDCNHLWIDWECNQTICNSFSLQPYHVGFNATVFGVRPNQFNLAAVLAIYKDCINTVATVGAVTASVQRALFRFVGSISLSLSTLQMYGIFVTYQIFRQKTLRN